MIRHQHKRISIKLKPQAKLHWGWRGLAFSSSGLLAGICCMGGPSLVLWAMAHDWSTQKIRGFLFAAFTISLPIQILIMAFTFESSIVQSILMGVMLTPAIYIGAKIGLPLGNTLSKSLMRKILLFILLGIGLSSSLPFVYQFLIFKGSKCSI
ncbi:hypothetical protein [Marinicellulosiphila megalodicopiae]|uniref:hypothetical protein n=1 Tax=Marinicellulosiphila megalodicopiae TaxID=2724896 RepID=UPI003BAE87B7